VLANSAGKPWGIWAIGGTAPVHSLPADSLADVAFHDDSKRFIVTLKTKSEAVRVEAWRIGDASPLGGFSADGVRGVAYAPDGVHVAVRKNDAVELWRLDAKAPEKTWPIKDDGPTAIAFSPDGARLAVGMYRGDVLVLPISEGPPQIHFGAKDRGDVARVVFSRDGRLVLGILQNNLAFVWKVGRPNPVQRIETPGVIEGLADFDPDKRHVIAGTSGVMMQVPLAPLLFLSPREGMKVACERARKLGFTGFTDEDRTKFPILDSTVPDDPCVARGLLPPLPLPKPKPAEAALREAAPSSAGVAASN
jgi:hypothetical protein